jgi:outer membrane protein TolC
MMMPSLDHLPFMLHGADLSFMVEQRFALSHLRRDREHAAQAEMNRLAAEVDHTKLDVAVEAAVAFWMLYERREMMAVALRQLELAQTLVSAAAGRLAVAATAPSDVLRAEIEVARLGGVARVLSAEARSAEAMLNAGLARRVDAAIPELEAGAMDSEPPPFPQIRELALSLRPELQAGREEVRRADADIEVMRSMIKPMALVRTGPAYTMRDGWGFMATLGVSVPIYRSKNRATVAEASRMAAMARADLRAMLNMVQGGAASSREDVIAARTQALVLRDEVLPRAERTVGAVAAAYVAGSVPMVSALEASQALWQTRRELVMAKASLGAAWARLARAIGRFEAEDP